MHGKGRGYGAIVVAVALASAGLLFGASEPAESGLSDEAREGLRLYGYYCENCHGADAKGRGPTAAVLSVKPADLTRLAKGNGGEFPVDRVTKSIDGRRRDPAHGSKMPIWGLGFQDPSSDANQENEVRRRIEQLVAYLRSLQQ